MASKHYTNLTPQAFMMVLHMCALLSTNLIWNILDL